MPTWEGEKLVAEREDLLAVEGAVSGLTQQPVCIHGPHMGFLETYYIAHSAGGTFKVSGGGHVEEIYFPCGDCGRSRSYSLGQLAAERPHETPQPTRRRFGLHFRSHGSCSCREKAWRREQMAKARELKKAMRREMRDRRRAGSPPVR